MHCNAKYGSATSVCQCRQNVRWVGGVLEFKRVKKDSQFTFRIPSDLKVRLEEIALSEGRSVAQICVALLQEGTEIYKKKGPNFLKRLLSGQKRI
jgi:hypothetical protein